MERGVRRERLVAMDTVRRTARLPVSSLNTLILDEETSRRPEHNPDIRVSGRQYTTMLA